MTSVGFHLPARGNEQHQLTDLGSLFNRRKWVSIQASPTPLFILASSSGVLVALSGLLVLYRAICGAGRTPLLAHLAAAATVATAATWAVLQGLDGVALKQAVDAWDSSSGAEKRIRFANAETLRWLVWGFQSYFRFLLGLTFALFGVAILADRRVASWLGWLAVVTGLMSAAIGVDVGYNGLASGLQDWLGVAFLIVVLAFAFGVLAS